MSGGRGGVFGAIAVAITMIALAITAVPAFATADRADYDGQVNAICRSGSDQVLQAASNPQVTGPSILGIFRGELASLLLVPPAPGDESLVSSWLGNRQQIQADVERHIRLDNRLQKRDTRVFDGRHSVHAIKRFLKWEKRVDKILFRIDERAIRGDATDTSLGSSLGAGFCVGGVRVQQLILED